MEKANRQKSENTEKKTYRIAIDAMGGDFAPSNEIQGAISACSELKNNFDVEIVFVGKETKIRSTLSHYDCANMKFSIINADEVVTMHDDPSAALKKKKNSSLYKGLQMHANGYVDAFISVGNTGAVLSTSTVLLGRINGVSRPTIGSFFPTTSGHPSILLDVGANIDVKPRYLYEFAVMGSIYASNFLGLENPRVSLLNIGEEKSKGTKIVQETYTMLEDSHLNFIGNIEGRDLLIGSSDVIVCDGFSGNIILKFAESIPGFLKTMIKAYSAKCFLNKFKILLLLPLLKSVLSGLDYEEYGGVPLLGVNGSVIIGHGKSTPKAIHKMITEAVTLVRNDVNGKIETALNPEVKKENKVNK